MEKRMEVYYSGMVQGVGFRYTVLRIAEMFPTIKGFVRNMPNGKVQVIAEGEEKLLEGFQEKIQNSFLKGYIQGQEVLWDSPKREFNNFQIAF